MHLTSIFLVCTRTSGTMGNPRPCTVRLIGGIQRENGLPTLTSGGASAPRTFFRTVGRREVMRLVKRNRHMFSAHE